MTLVVVSEFGRRLTENASRGTDHGHGSGIFVLGGQVNGGRVISNWPGLQNEQLYDRADLAVTTDYRQVLGEIVVRRLGNARLGAVFPRLQGVPATGHRARHRLATGSLTLLAQAVQIGRAWQIPTAQRANAN